MLNARRPSLLPVAARGYTASPELSIMTAGFAGDAGYPGAGAMGPQRCPGGWRLLGRRSSLAGDWWNPQSDL